MKMRPIIWQARSDAAKVLDALNRKNDAGAKLYAAKAMVEEIAQSFRDEDLRKMFVENVTVR